MMQDMIPDEALCIRLPRQLCGLAAHSRSCVACLTMFAPTTKHLELRIGAGERHKATVRWTGAYAYRWIPLRRWQHSFQHAVHLRPFPSHFESCRKLKPLKPRLCRMYPIYIDVPPTSQLRYSILRASWSPFARRPGIAGGSH